MCSPQGLERLERRTQGASRQSNSGRSDVEQIIRVPSLFDGAEIDFVPDVWHDGAPKSVMSYDMFKQVGMFKHVDKMQDLVAEPSVDLFWEQGLNRTDVKTLSAGPTW